MPAYDAPVPMMRRFVLAVALSSCTVPQALAQGRAMRPDDLFRVARIGAIAWSPDGARAAVEIHRPGAWLVNVPTAEIAIVDAASARLRVITPTSRDIVGFFGPSWSPDDRRLAFFSVDVDAKVQPWLWSVGDAAPRRLADVVVVESTLEPPRALWIDGEHLVLRLRDPGEKPEGGLYFAIQRGRNVADEWQRARASAEAAVSVFDARGGQPAADQPAPRTRLTSIDVRTRAMVTLATGAIHVPRISADGRTLTYREESPAVPAASVATFFSPAADVEAAYSLVNFGAATRHIDARTGATVEAPAAAPAAAAKTPAADRPSLRVANDPAVGTTVWLQRPGREDVSVWTGNAWIREIATGRAEAIAYRSTAGAPLTGWLVYPPGHVAGQKLPIVTWVYPGRVYSERTPSSLDLFNSDFEHPQLFAALGFGVALPSMPDGENPLQKNALDALSTGVIPFLDVLVERGIADPRRIAVGGQSAGGWATLGLIGRTDRFRSAIASASYSNLVSLYGTFYGPYRYGDAGHPHRAQLLRMLQFERGYFGAGAPPWEQPNRYRINSPLWSVASVKTPLLLVHGDLDYIPVQQAEEFFTALYRQDKRAQLVRYAGEWHTISARTNVLDMWRRFEAWLRETMPSD
jgi:dipeptidyl aminopeptidase/acylaminoacyl peptidase